MEQPHQSTLNTTIIRELIIGATRACLHSTTLTLPLLNDSTEYTYYLEEYNNDFTQ